MSGVSRKSARWTGRALIAVAAAMLALNVAWVARNYELLRPLAAGDPAPAFELPRLSREGRALPERLALGKLRGRVVLVDFWASWCGPCRASMPTIERLYREYRERGFDVVSVKTDGPEMGAASRVIAATTFPIVLDPEGAVAARYKVVSYPHLVLIDRGGVVRFVHRGGTDKGELATQIERLLR